MALSPLRDLFRLTEDILANSRTSVLFFHASKAFLAMQEITSYDSEETLEHLLT